MLTSARRLRLRVLRRLIGQSTAGSGRLVPVNARGGEVADTVEEFFSGLNNRVDPAKTAGMKNSYVFEIEGAGTWKVDVDDGKVTATPGGGDADCTIAASQETFEKIVRGEQNPTTAYMTGKLKVKGDMGAAMKLQKLF
jgi:alkyl sulfatase BDS1-like metallo-beta-lactamase superfamily hydrolase